MYALPAALTVSLLAFAVAVFAVLPAITVAP